MIGFGFGVISKLATGSLMLRSSPDPRLSLTSVGPIELPNVVFAAADMSSREFSSLRTSLLERAHRITVYCSDDTALVWSRWVNDSDERLGACVRPKDPKDLMEGISFVRVSGKIRDWANHSYYINSPEILADISRSLAGESQALTLPGVPVQTRYREIFLER
jgi:esterase/lipase superfamily enzyme